NPPPPGGAGKLYVTNEDSNQVLRFDGVLTATGNLTPAATISNSAQISAPQYLAIDAVNNRLYVATSGAVLVYDQASTKNGSVNADRTIGGLTAPQDLALDRGHDLLYVADSGTVRVFSGASSANGSPAPARTIVPQVAGSGIVVSAIFLDTVNDRLYIADSLNAAVDIYDGANTLNGNVNANRSLSGPSTGLARPEGVQVDAIGRLIVANNNPPSITIYPNAATVTGDLAPTSTVRGASNTLQGPSQIFVTTGNELYVADGVQGAVPIFAGFNAANGTISPTRNITGSKTTITTAGRSTVRGLALDATR
ncbi:MAG TPA: beta-propeller fold lactonase family protein, partial [Candidatus Saccharimonadales bacterium]|nr:beta-propeller fold lactonase family protein [Candidatus Saccharimonadales bacterium]